MFETLRVGSQVEDANVSHQIVQAASAGFFDEPAVKVLGTDHHTICKFATSQRAYRIVEGMLCKVMSVLVDKPQIEDAC